VLELEHVDDRDAAEALAARDVTADRDALPAPAAGEYYECDLVGSLVERADGQVLGTLVEILDTGANDVWVVRGVDGRELLIPAVAHAVLAVDAARRRVVVDPACAMGADEPS
jgi:16S rRNA processing protein RimM